MSQDHQTAPAGVTFGAGAATSKAAATPRAESPHALSTQTKRLNVNLPEAKFAELETLAKSSHRTMTDMVRLALDLVALAIKEEEHGRRLAVVESDGRLSKEIVLLR